MEATTRDTAQTEQTVTLTVPSKEEVERLWALRTDAERQVNELVAERDALVARSIEINKDLHYCHIGELCVQIQLAKADATKASEEWWNARSLRKASGLD